MRQLTLGLADGQGKPGFLGWVRGDRVVRCSYSLRTLSHTAAAYSLMLQRAQIGKWVCFPYHSPLATSKTICTL